MTIREDIEHLVRKALTDAQSSELLPNVDVEIRS